MRVRRQEVSQPIGETYDVDRTEGGVRLDRCIKFLAQVSAREAGVTRLTRSDSGERGVGRDGASWFGQSDPLGRPVLVGCGDGRAQEIHQSGAVLLTSDVSGGRGR